jgi:hypothetical protein
MIFGLGAPFTLLGEGGLLSLFYIWFFFPSIFLCSQSERMDHPIQEGLTKLKHHPSQIGWLPSRPYCKNLVNCILFKNSWLSFWVNVQKLNQNQKKNPLHMSESDVLGKNLQKFNMLSLAPPLNGYYLLTC